MEFKALGKRVSQPSRDLESFPTPPNTSLVRFTSNEITSLCPITKQPDFNTITIEYCPDKLCLESKSLKLYLWSFREEAQFVEQLASQIASDINKAISPKQIAVTLAQNIRGGLQLTTVSRINNE